jgi:hypothetical protein
MPPSEFDRTLDVGVDIIHWQRKTSRVQSSESPDVDANYLTSTLTSGPPEFPGSMAVSVWM